METLNQIIENRKMSCLIEMLDRIIEFGQPRQLSRNQIRASYIECLDTLGRFYTNLSEALSDLYVLVTEHKSFPRHFGNSPMTLYDARDYEARLGKGGITTGFNRFQGWARKNHEEFNPARAKANPIKYRQVSEIEITDFLDYLKNSHPLQERLQIAIHLHDGVIEFNNKRLRGHVSKNQDSNVVNMHINSAQREYSVYGTIAHEYRHIMQWMNTDIEWLTFGDKIIDEEIDARLFSQKMIQEYCYPKHMLDKF